MKEGWLRCRQCDEVIRLTPYDCLPEYHYEDSIQDFVEKQCHDRTPFEDKHGDHHLERLVIDEGSYVSTEPFSSPTGTTFVEATNGKERFVIKRWRTRVDEPLHYELIHGRIEITGIAFEVQSDQLTRQMEAELTCPPVAPEKIEAFVKEIENMIPGLAVIEQSESFQTEDPLTTHVKLNDSLVNEILEAGKKIFSPREFPRVERFVHIHNEHADVMTLKARKEFRICQDAAVPSGSLHSLATHSPI
jgi:hypothetical protein